MDVLEYTEGLRVERMRLFEQSTAIYDEAIASKRELSAEERQKVERMDARDVELLNMIKDADEGERRTREAAAAREAHEREFGTERSEKTNRSLAQEFRAWAVGAEQRAVQDAHSDTPRMVNGWTFNLAGAQAKRELIRQGATGEELRSLLYDTGSAGSLVPTLLDDTIYAYMTAGIAAFNMPTQKITTAGGGPLDFPTVAAHGIATQVKAQGTALSGTDPTFGKITLNSYKVGELLQVAAETIADNGVNLMEFIGGNLARAVGQEGDRLLMAGSGSGMPQGMSKAATTGAAGTVATGGTLAAGALPPVPYNALVDAVYGVNDQYRSDPSVAWLMRDATAGQLRKLRDGGAGTVGAVLWRPSLTEGIQGGQPGLLLDYPVYTDPNVASLASDANVAWFGAWRTYLLRTVGALTIERSDEFAFNTDLVTYRAKSRIDGDFIDLTGVVTLHNAVT